MSADSPRRGVHKGAQLISPQPIVDRSIIDSVAGIINDIVPQTYVGTPNSDNKESISWARFEYADVNDPALYPDYNEGSGTPPLLLVLGYTTGVQVWLIAATGEATEVLSWRQGVVRTLRILPNPKTDDEHVDLFEAKRPMVAICDSAGPGPQFCNISFISLKTGEQAKSIKFKNPVCDILANRRSIVVTFLEKIAVFDARTLEDILTVTTCYASPGPNPNPVALGTRWLAYSEKKLLPAKRSSGGCEGDGVQSYTATVLYAAKSLGKGLRGIGETVASSLTGNSVSPIVVNNTGSDVTQPGVITILDLQVAKEEKKLDDANIETVIAHFTAHSDAIVAMTFDLSGALLMTADKRGHDFYVFRIQPHPGGPTLAAVHHLYILHRGDTTAKVQDMVFSSDTRWAAVSTVRGTTHVFPVAPYGGPVGVRTHSTPHVVNRLSRFHRSAGLMDDGARSHSPVSHSELPLSVYPYSNPRLPPYPHPTVLHPLAQIRQPSSLNHANSQAQPSRPQQRQRLHSDDSGTLPLKICACFAPPRAWMYAQRESTTKVTKRAIDSLFIMACHGNMIQYDLEPKPAAGVPKEKVCDDTMIELEVEAKGQWPLLRAPNSTEIVPPLLMSSPLLSITNESKDRQDVDLAEDRWLSQVEIVTHAGPHRRLWMGPQFVFKTYNATSGGPVNLVEAEAVEVGVTGGSRPARSNPVNMPHAASRALVPVVIDGSGSSYEQSPRLMEVYSDSLESANTGIGSGENQLQDDLAEAMLETSIAPHRAPGRRLVFERVGLPVTKVVNPLGTVITVSADEEDGNSSQEFDTSEESHVPEPSRSICAEEGPASLGDLEPESQTLPDLTEVCVEMRPATEPAIDNVPDEDIREVKERKALCVEAAPIAQPGTSIDFERTEAFRDVPTNLSLCVEQGEIPSSPMTQAKETAWCKDLPRKFDVRAHEGNASDAQFVVNCDDDSVVLMESNSGRTRPSKSENLKNEIIKKSSDRERTRKSGKSNIPSENNTGRSQSGYKTHGKKYIVQELGDSIIIEGTCIPPPKNECTKMKGCSSGEKECAKEKEQSIQLKPEESCKATTGKSKTKLKSSTPQTSRKDIDNASNIRSPENKIVEPILEVKEPETMTKSEDEKIEVLKFHEDIEVAPDCPEKCKSPCFDIPSDDFTSMDYHVIEPNYCSKDTTFFNQSDEDIEHIQRSEIAQIQQSDCIDIDKCGDSISCAGSSPTSRRKNSKNTISDDDLEYIHTSELNEEVSDLLPSKDELKLLDADKISDCESNVSAKTGKQVIFSDDDLEHIQHSDVCALVPEISHVKENRDNSSTKKQYDGSPDHASKSKSNNKPKDIVVIENDTSAAEATVIVKPVDEWKIGKNMDRKSEESEEVTMKTEGSSTDLSVSPVRKVKSKKRVPAATISKRPQGLDIEIIDIDAMQKAEMEISQDVASTPECKILPVPQETSTSRPKKQRKTKKSQADSSAQNTTVPEASPSSGDTWKPVLSREIGAPEFSAEQAQVAPYRISWSSIVKKKSITPEESDGQLEDEMKRLEEKKEREESPASIEKPENKKKIMPEPLAALGSMARDADSLSVDISSLVESLALIDELQEAATDRNTVAVPLITEAPRTSVKKKSSAIDLVSTEARSRKKRETPVDTSKVPEAKVLSTKKSESVAVELEKVCGTDTLSSNNPKDLKELPSRLEVSSKEGKSASSKKMSKVTASVEDTPAKVDGLEKVIEDVSDDDKNKTEDVQVDVGSSKEDSSEAEHDLEKRSDSEQEVVPERSSSSEELNANVLTRNKGEDSSGQEIVERSSVNGSNSAVCSTAKKGNRSKKKKRR